MVPLFRSSRVSRVLPGVLALALSGGALVLGATPASAGQGVQPGPISITVGGDPDLASVRVDKKTQVMFACAEPDFDVVTGATIIDRGVPVSAEFDAGKWFADFYPEVGQTDVRIVCEHDAGLDVDVDHPIQTIQRESAITAGRDGENGNVTATAGSVVPRSVKVIPYSEFPYLPRVPSGLVEFRIDNVVVGSPVALDGAGIATTDLLVPALGGDYVLTVRYLGDLAFRPVSPDFADILTVPEVVVPVVTTLSTTPTITHPVATPLVLAASVAAQNSQPTGNVVVTEGATLLKEGTVGPDGTVSLPVGVLTTGNHTLTLSYAGDALHAASTATVTVTIGGEPARSTPEPNVGVALDTPTPAVLVGGSVTLLGEDFDAGETVAFYLHSDPVYLGTVVADAQGRARLVVTLPAGVPTGPHTAIATGGTSGRWATTAITVSAPAQAVNPPVQVPGVPAAAPVVTAPGPIAVAPRAGTSRSALAATGAEPLAATSGALALVLGGAGLAAWARRPRAVHVRS